LARAVSRNIFSGDFFPVAAAGGSSSNFGVTRVEGLLTTRPEKEIMRIVQILGKSRAQVSKYLTYLP